MIITPVTTTSAKGKKILADLRDRFQLADPACQQSVTGIISEIRQRGDEALVEYIRKFDAPKMSVKQLRVSDEELHAAMESVDDAFLDALEIAIERIYTFHEREKEQSWMVTREDGAITGRLVHPVDSAGLYVPGGQGGKTPLVSSVLMNGIPAAIAGVERRVMMTPPDANGKVNPALLVAAQEIGITEIYKAGSAWAIAALAGVERRVMMTPPDANGKVNPALLVAAQEIGITEIYKAGSAWAIAALAYGTKTIAPVDVIVGPGNQYVTEAKRQVAGRVRIDMIAGPSEVLIIADETGEPSYIAADMLAQAEHDPLALAMCITTSKELAGQIVKQLEKQLAKLSRAEIAKKSLSERGVILIAKDLDESILLANQIAAEHLELMVSEPFLWLTRVRHAGAIFLGRHTPESAGDYLAGPNHVLPTMGTARFSSALGVETFVKKSSLIAYSEEALQADSAHIQLLAKLEGLTAHANSVAIRTKKK